MIEFITENVEMPALDLTKIGRWVEAVAGARGMTTGRICYCFCDDEYILRANREFLGHDYYTDVITFDYAHAGRISGDVIISLDTVRSNAAGLGVAYESELLRVIIHGVLHLCGVPDKGPGEREVMEAAENEALSIFADV